MKAGDLCPLCKKGILKLTDEKHMLACDNSECNWVTGDSSAGLARMFDKEE